MLTKNEFIDELGSMGRDQVYYDTYNDIYDTPYAELCRFSYSAQYPNLVDQANHIALCELLPNSLKWVNKIRGSIIIDLSALPRRSPYFEIILDSMRFIERDPLLDDELYYRLENETIEEDWQDYGRSDLERMIRKHMIKIDPDNEYGWNTVDLENEEIDGLRHLLDETGNEYPYVESGGGTYFPYKDKQLTPAVITSWLEEYPIELPQPPPPFDYVAVLSPHMVDRPLSPVSITWGTGLINLPGYVYGTLAITPIVVDVAENEEGGLTAVEFTSLPHVHITHIPSGRIFIRVNLKDETADQLSEIWLVTMFLTYVANDPELTARLNTPEPSQELVRELYAIYHAHVNPTP